MRRLLVFNSVTLDGYFVDSKGDMSWAHIDDAEFNAFVQGNARGGGSARPIVAVHLHCHVTGFSCFVCANEKPR